MSWRSRRSVMRLVRNIGMSLCAPVAALVLLVAAPGAHADTGFVKAWGWGVSSGAAQFESCTTTCQAGLHGVGDAGELTYPEGAAVSATGNVLIANTDLERIDVFSAAGLFVRTIGSLGTGAGQLIAPWGVATDPSGNDVYVTEFGDDRVSEFTESGAFVRTFGWGVRTGTATPEICTANCHAGIPGSGAGQLDHPRGVALDGAGHVFVVDSANDRVAEFTLAGDYVRSFGAIGTGSGELGGSNGD